MSKTAQKALSVFVSATLVFGMVPTYAFATTGLDAGADSASQESHGLAEDPASPDSEEGEASDDGVSATLSVSLDEGDDPIESNEANADSSNVEAAPQSIGSVDSYDQFVDSLVSLEGYARAYAQEHEGEDANSLIINFIRTGVTRYTTSNWTTFCGPENTSFTGYVAEQDAANGTSATALRDLKTFTLPNGDEVDFGHMFGCLDMAWHTKNQGTADLGSWAGDLSDLIWLVSTTGIEQGTVDQMADVIRTDSTRYFLHALDTGGHSFSSTDLYGDLDSLYILRSIESGASITSAVKNYFTANLTNTIRSRNFLSMRLSESSTREDIRSDVYGLYMGNEGVLTLEGTYLPEGVNDDIRKASCYAFADWIYLNAFDEAATSYYSVFSSESSTLAPGVTHVRKKAMTVDNKQIVYQLATVDVSRDDVTVEANYKDNDASSWGMQRVSEQMQAAERRHGDPNDSENYVPNYRAVAGVNADFYDMSNGVPSGALVMNGEQYHGAGNENFFAILDDGSAVIGAPSDWSAYKSRVREAVGASIYLVKDGKPAVSANDNYTSNRVSRTCVGITYDGKVVLMVLDGRQEPYSAGGAAQEIAQIMIEAGCVTAVNLDGGGSATFAGRPEGSDEISVMNSPSDGYERSVSSSLVVVSTARLSNEFDHALVSSDYDYLTVGTDMSLTVTGVSATGGPVDIPEGATLRLQDDGVGTLSGNTFTASALGDARLQLVAADGNTVLGSKTLHVVEPTDLRFGKPNVNAIYGQSTELPLEASYNGNPVKINDQDVTFGYLKETLQSIGSIEGSEVNTTKKELVFDYPEAGSIENFRFTPAADCTLRTLKVGAVLTSKLQDFEDTINNEFAKAYQEALANGASEESALASAQNTAVTKALETVGSIDIYMYNEDEASFDFNAADGQTEDATLAWKREVPGSVFNPDEGYYPLTDGESTGQINYTFAVDMSKVPIPKKLSGLLYMLPGGDQEGRTAWDFMLQLAERISPCTTVTLDLTIPDGFTVDTSHLSLANELFKVSDIQTNGNKLTITLGFIRQTEPVNPTTANPLCVMSGVELVPNDDAPWDKDGLLPAGIQGTLSYDIYAHFHSLKNLASNPEFQEKYGLYPYDNSENLEGDYGAHFSDTVATITDEFSLLHNVQHGWVRKDGAWTYFDESGHTLTGIQELPSFTEGEDGTFWYDLGVSGSCTAKYTGLVQRDGKTFYARFGSLVSGWQAVQDDGDKTHYYFFDPSTHEAKTGESVVSGLTYTFNDAGQLVRGAFHSDGSGIRYNWAGRDLWRQFVTLDEGTYWIDADLHVAHGNEHTVDTNVKDVTWYHFDEDTGLMTGLCTGIFTYHGAPYYADENGKVHYGLIQTADGIVFCETLGALSISKGVYVDDSTEQHGCSLSNGWYYAGEKGFLQRDGFATINGNTYHYQGYAIEKGLKKIDGDYYLFNAGTGRMYANGRFWVDSNPYGIAPGTYRFDADGRLVTKSGWQTETGEDGASHTYYYVNGSKATGLTKIGSDWYLFDRQSGALVSSGSYRVNDNEGGSGLAAGTYPFDAQGRLQLDGWVTSGGRTYYYAGGAKATGLTRVGDDWYLFNRANGNLYKDGKFWVNENEGGCGLAGGLYRFDADGRLVTKSGWQTETGEDGASHTYYYVNGSKATGLTKIGSDWYLFDRQSGALVSSGSYRVNDNEGGSGLAAGTYPFDAQGRLQLDGWVTSGGRTYYYAGGAKATGLTRVGDDWYLFNRANGNLYRDGTFWVNENEGGCGLAGGLYRFDADGWLVMPA